jgi:putative transposase
MCERGVVADHMKQTLGFSALASAVATLEGAEVTNLIRKGQLKPEICPFQQIAEVAA